MNYLRKVSDIVGDPLFRRVYENYANEIETFPASIKFHHCERGGYIRHVWEVLNFCNEINKIGGHVLVDTLIRLAFIHDLDKLERYELDPEKPTDAQIKYANNLGIRIDAEDSKSSLSTKIDNKKNGLNKPISYYRYRELLPFDESAKVVQICGRIGVSLTDEDVHCLAVHHGGWSEAGKRGTMSPMATILHCADLMSAKILGEV